MSKKPLASWRLVSVVALATTTAMCAALPTVANAADAAAGKQLFQDKTCSACHTVGGGDLVGPDLKNVTKERPHEWLQQWLAAPDKMIAKKDPVAIELLHKYNDMEMPNLGLSCRPRWTIILAYLESAAGGAASSELLPRPPPSRVMPRRVRICSPAKSALQTVGRRAWPVTAPAASGLSAAERLGPDLTDVAKRLGGANGLNGWLAGLPTPTMKAVWTKQPPTPQERANVAAFLAQAGLAVREPSAIWQLVGLTGLGAAIILLIAGFRWRNRLKFGVRRPMMATPTTGRSTGPYHGGWFTGTYADGWMGRFKE